MAPPSRFALLGRGHASRKDNDAWTNDALPKRDPKTMTKAERLLGMGDSNGAQAQKKAFEPKKKTLRGNAFTNAFSDWRGVLVGSSSNSRTSSHGRTPSSPAIKTNVTDSDSMTSMTSPTFDATTSTSTLPSYYDPPMSPYFSTHNSSGPSSPHEIDARHDYHAIISSSRNKVPYESDMPVISEIFDPVDDKDTELPPLEKAPLSSNAPSTPKHRNSFGPVTRLRSPSSTSITTESTVKGKWLGWKQAKLLGRDLGFEPVPRVAEQHLNNGFTRAEISLSKPSNAIEDWLARADLERRPSQSSVMTKMTIPRSVVSSTFSPNSSQLSVRTLTTQKDTTATPQPQPMAGRTLRYSRSSDDMLSQIRETDKALKAGGIDSRDLLVESVLTFSSSEDEESDGDGGSRRTKRSKRISIIRNPNNPSQVKLHVSRSSLDSTSTFQGRHFISDKSGGYTSTPKSTIKHQHHGSTSSSVATSRASFQSIQWQNGDPTELGNVCVATAAKVYPGNVDGGLIEIPAKRPSIASQISPTSRVMVISKKEEKLLAAMREKKAAPMDLSSNTKVAAISPAATTAKTTSGVQHTRHSTEDNTISTTSNPIISVSPPRRKKKRPKALEGAEEMTKVDENSVISFPPPPSTPKSKSKAFALNLSSESLTDLPEVVAPDKAPQTPPQPKHSEDREQFSMLLSPSVASRNSGNFSSVSELTASAADEIPGTGTGSVSTEGGQSQWYKLGTGYGPSSSIGVAISHNHGAENSRERIRIPPVPSIPSELYGSVPDLTEVLHTGLGQRNSQRARSRTNSARSKVYITGLENGGVGYVDEDLEAEEDIKKYVMASVM